MNIPLVYIELKVGTVLRGFLCIFCLYIKSCFSNSKLSGQTVRWEVETRAGCVGGRKLLWSASLVCFCVVCREMDHVNTSASCTFFLLVLLFIILFLDGIFNKLYKHVHTAEYEDML